MRGDEEGVGLVVVVVVGDVLHNVLHVQVHAHHPHQLQALRAGHRRVEAGLGDAQGQAWGHRHTLNFYPAITQHLRVEAGLGDAQGQAWGQGHTLNFYPAISQLLPSYHSTPASGSRAE